MIGEAAKFSLNNEELGCCFFPVFHVKIAIVGKVKNLTLKFVGSICLFCPCIFELYVEFGNWNGLLMRYRRIYLDMAVALGTIYAVSNS